MTAIATRAAELARRAASFAPAPQVSGSIVSHDGLLMSAIGLAAPIGTRLHVAGADHALLAEAVGFREGKLLLMALERGAVAPGARVALAGRADLVATGPGLLGRVVDGLGEPVDGLGPLRNCPQPWPLAGKPLPPLDRSEVTQPLATGVRAIDALFTLGRGQRVGLIAGSGVGKSVLLHQLVHGAAADAVVVALIGERGREIAGFVGGLSAQDRARTHIVAVPADQPGPLRMRGAMAAFAAAEWLRAQGKHCLLLLDSLTRVAHAQREIGLAVGEPGGSRGYPASALSLIPRLVERAGNDRRSGGAITAIFTVLADGDDTVADPVVDTARGVLDGHIVLDRAIAARGRYPAIDLGASISRTMAQCVPPAHQRAAAALSRNAALVEANRDLVAMGAWQPGQDAALDCALAGHAALEAFLQQPRDAVADFRETSAALLAGWSA